ncbi:hypothetical protein GGI42DRAFT_331326 [Trichoderma sp. SZMC 28013]
MAAFYSNEPNIIFLKSVLEEKANKWGKHPMDYSPTEEFSIFLQSHGFTHSRTYWYQQNKLNVEHEEYKSRRHQQSFIEGDLDVLGVLKTKKTKKTKRSNT